MKKLLSLMFILMFVIFLQAQEEIYPNCYAVYFKDKANSKFSVEKPEEFLSQKALQRRQKFNIKITNQDLPVNENYVKALSDAGFKVLKVSKWLNCAIVTNENNVDLNTLKEMDFFIEKPNPAEKNYKYKAKKRKKISKQKHSDKDKYNYGVASNQNKMVNINALHNLGYTGKGITIAILDGGFLNVDKLPSFVSLWQNQQIKGWFDFVDMDTVVFDKGSHGMMVLSVMGGKTDNFLGTAPDADFWLFATEDGKSEYPIEEYNYVLACERADSVGCDMIHASLGYAEFDDKTKSHKYEDLNGNTSVASIGADIAASKGILLTVSAGNSGNSKWRYITPPADADSVLTIGAVNVKRKATKFSSEGPTPDGRVKPEVCAMGLYTYLQLVNGKMGMKSGTSFSSPLIAGATACLWQANPDKTNMQIIDAIIRSADKIKKPDVKYGYGIPDFYKAHIYLKKKK